MWLAPWTAIYVVDWALRRGRYEASSLVDEHGGRYFRKGGIHVPGVVAQLVGMAASAMWINSTAFAGPLSSVADHSDFSVLTGLLGGGLAYYVLARRSVPAEESVALEPAGVVRAAAAELV